MLFTKEKEKSVLSQGNEVIIPSSGESPEEIARASVVKKEGIILGGDLNVIKTSKDIDPIFLAYNISNGRQQKELSKRAQGKSVVHLHNSDLMQVSLTYPKAQEQQKIGVFFKKIDDTIALHQRKLEKLELLKKGFLQLTFPQKEENTPRLRFANFSEEWKERKLDEIIVEQKKGKSKLESLNEGKVEYLDTERLNGGFPLYLDGPKDVEKEDILILWDGSKAGKIYKGFEGSLGSTLKKFKINEKNNSEFIYQYLLREQNIIYNSYRTPNIPHVIKNFTKLFSVQITSMEEQKQIGRTLKYLDILIIQIEKKINVLKKLKNEYLQKMFV